MDPSQHGDEPAPGAARRARRRLVSGLSARYPRLLPRLAAFLQASAALALFLSLVLGLSWGMYRYLRQSPRFAIRVVEVEGNHRLSQEDLSRAAGLTLGSNVFAVDLDTARARLLDNPWIRDASVERRLPSTFHLRVVEREAIALACLQPSNELLLVSTEGELFKPIEPGDPSDLPVLTGLSVDLGRDGIQAQVKRALELLSSYEHMPLAKRYPPQEIHAAEDGRLSLVIGKQGVVLALGDSPSSLRLERAERVLSEIDRRHARAAEIFLDNAAHPERVVARLR